MLSVVRHLEEPDPGTPFKPAYFGIYFDEDGRNGAAIGALVAQKLPGAAIRFHEGSTCMYVFRGEYDGDDAALWNGWSANDVLQRLGEPRPLTASVFQDPVFSWALLLRTDRELSISETRGLTLKLGLMAAALPLREHATAGFVYRLSMQPGNHLPHPHDIARLLGFTLEDEF